MSVAKEIHELCVRAKAASRDMRRLSHAAKDAALAEMANALESARDEIFAANAEDVRAAKDAGMSPAMVDRLTLTDSRFRAMVAGVREVMHLPDPVGHRIWRRARPSGIVIDKVREPLGVIAVVFESRPNVFVDTAALCLKTSNAIILRGGKEALRSNKALAAAVRAGLAASEMPADAVQLVTTTDHSAVAELVRAVGLVDVAIPRGGERLIRAMCEAALIPVLKHYKGVCHVYVDDAADAKMAIRILDNAKVQRPSACNAAECVLIHEAMAEKFLPMLHKWADKKGVALHFGGVEGGDVDWGREFLGLELNVGIVKDVNAAIAHINAHGSGHSDAIVTANPQHAKRFQREVDSAAVYWNCSTRFTDGAEFGMGAEIGISTDKLHARGPMGLEELTTYKYVVHGSFVTGTVRK